MVNCQRGKISPRFDFYQNISRGHHYEDEAITNFQNISDFKTEKCGFFLHPTDSRYGSRPDVLGPLAILLKLKTRGEGSSSPLESREKFPHNFVKCQLQMLALVLSSVFCNLTTLNQRLQNFSLLNIIIH